MLLTGTLNIEAGGVEPRQPGYRKYNKPTFDIAHHKEPTEHKKGPLLMMTPPAGHLE
ncbi:MAG: hypothetical protein ACI915_003463 [Gammaproteobacteria bacterium]